MGKKSASSWFASVMRVFRSPSKDKSAETAAAQPKELDLDLEVKRKVRIPSKSVLFCFFSASYSILPVVAEEGGEQVASTQLRSFCRSFEVFSAPFEAREGVLRRRLHSGGFSRLSGKLHCVS